MSRPFAIVTGGSSGIGLELARLAAQHGHDLLIAADVPLADADAQALRAAGGSVDFIDVDLSTIEGVDRLVDTAGDRDVDILCANAGHGLGRDFMGQDVARWRHVVDTNITGTVYLVQRIGQRMIARDEGRILVTGSIAGLIPGSFQAVYNGTKAFIDSFTEALRNELKDSNVVITNLMPGATDTCFFERADMLDTQVGTDPKKEDPAITAKNGWDALMKGEAHEVSGIKNKLQAAATHIVPESMLAEQHRGMAEPGSADR